MFLGIIIGLNFSFEIRVFLHSSITCRKDLTSHASDNPPLTKESKSFLAAKLIKSLKKSQFGLIGFLK